MDEIPKCSYCGSTSVLFEASLSWNVDDQKFEVETVFDEVTCTHCQRDGYPTWYSLDECLDD